MPGPRPRLLAAAVLGASLTLAACAEESGGDGGGGGTGECGPLTIGAVLDLTGAGASLGGPQRTALEMLVEQVNAEGGVNGNDVELVIEDNESTEDAAAQAANKLVTEDQVDVLLGSSRTGPSLAMRPIAESAEVPMISLAAGSQIIEGSDWVFKTAQNDSAVIEKMVDYAADQGWQSLGLARDASSFGGGVGEALRETGASEDIQVATTEQFAPDATDFTAQMVNIRDAGADANVIWGIPPASGLAQAAYRQLGIEAPVLHSHGSASQAFLDAAGAAADGALVTVGRIVVADQLPADDPQAEVISQFVTDFREASGGEQPSPFAGYAYDAFNLAVDAAEEAGCEGQAIRDQLEQVEKYVGVSGIFTMSPEDHSGLGPDALTIAEVRDGDFTRIETGS